MELRELDLNLLVIFNQLLVEPRVSKVADTLGLTQPAVSNALARLRKALGDELFLRTPRGMVPTPFAAQLAEPIAGALGMMHSALNQSAGFDPATSRRAFTIAMTDIGEIYFLPKLMDALSRLAPGVTVSTVRDASVNLRDEMEAGHVDAAIGLLPALKAGFFKRRLFMQPYVVMFRRGHRLARPGALTLEAFQRAEHVVAVSPGTGHGKVDELLDRSGVQRHVRLRVPHFVAVGHLLHASDMIATVPERYATQCVEPFGLTYAPHPAKLPDIPISLFWHAKMHKDPASQWLRNLLFEMHVDAA